MLVVNVVVCKCNDGAASAFSGHCMDRIFPFGFMICLKHNVGFLTM